MVVQVAESEHDISAEEARGSRFKFALRGQKLVQLAALRRGFDAVKHYYHSRPCRLGSPETVVSSSQWPAELTGASSMSMKRALSS